MFNLIFTTINILGFIGLTLFCVLFLRRALTPGVCVLGISRIGIIWLFVSLGMLVAG